jgi:hypothetical protein
MYNYLPFQSSPIFDTAMLILKVHSLRPIFIYVTENDKCVMITTVDNGCTQTKTRHRATWPTGLGSTRRSGGKSQQPTALAKVPPFCQLFPKNEVTIQSCTVSEGALDFGNKTVAPPPSILLTRVELAFTCSID